METADLAASLVATKVANFRSAAQFAVLRKQFQMEKSAMDMLLPAPPAPPPQGTGRLVDKTA